MTRPTVVGIDLSLTATGWSDGTITRAYRSTGHREDTYDQRLDRMVKIADKVALTSGHADLIVIEAPALSRNNAGTFDRAGLWWMVYGLLTGPAGRPVATVTPSALKLYAAGKGNAGKPDMLAAAITRLPLIEHGNDDNRVDALWLAAMGLHHLGHPLCDLPARQADAVSRVTWPALDVIGIHASHDADCEADYIPEAGASTPCRCLERAISPALAPQDGTP